MIKEILGHPLVYRAWQAPFVEQKLRTFRSHYSRFDVGRVIDVGCGPGINSRLFAPDRYVGVDLSERYVADARRRLPHRFEVWDITKPGPELGKFDHALINSVFHHLSDEETKTVLDALPHYLSPGAVIHIIDLVLPDQPSLARTLAQHDRGLYPRSVESWRDLFGRSLQVSRLEPFQVGMFGARLWEMIYAEGSIKS
jgi:SAM-dependent methyltransferase